MLRVTDSKTGYFGVCLAEPGKPKPYQARLKRGGKEVYLGYFTTAEEAALHAARSPEGQAAAKRAASAAPQLSEEEGKGAVPPMPSDAFVKTEAVVKEEERSGSRPKRQRTK